ncbi:hypothetical protein MMC07_008811 [Pseudocyphellaria aurata]|nr:hypothetical protein [Pseudocyphellaria aurata]
MEASNPEVEALGALSLDQAPLRHVKPARDYPARRAKKKLGTPPPRNHLSSSSSLSKLPKVPLRQSDSSIALRKEPLQHLPVPVPNVCYLAHASIPPTPLSTPQRLLVVLDLNGTLLYRSRGSSSFHPRPFLPEFLNYCLANHALLVWSSATAPNVSAICARLFQPHARSTLLGEWARDTLGLTNEQYASRIQVYKRLDRIWDNPGLSSTHPLAHEGGKWSQVNTLLIDDSAMKASAQPYSVVQIPEFVKGGAEKKTAENDVLGQVVGYLEEARRWGDVSAFSRERPFKMNCGWGWDWKEKKNVKPAVRKKQGSIPREEEGYISSDADEEEGGVKLEG